MPSFRSRRAGALARLRYAGKKAFSKRVTTYRNRPSVSRSLTSRRIGPYGFHTHMYKRYGDSVNWVFTGDGTTQYDNENFVFSLNDVANSSELTQLYDQYKISCVVLKFSLVPNPDAFYVPNVTTNGAVNGMNYYPKLWYVRDYDDTNPLSLPSVKEIGKARCFTMKADKTYSIKVKPAVLNLLSGTTTQPVWPKRLDVAAATQTHYGLKCVLDFNGTAPPSTATWRIRVEKLYYLKMFNSR